MWAHLCISHKEICLVLSISYVTCVSVLCEDDTRLLQWNIPGISTASILPFQFVLRGVVCSSVHYHVPSAICSLVYCASSSCSLYEVRSHSWTSPTWAHADTCHLSLYHTCQCGLGPSSLVIYLCVATSMLCVIVPTKHSAALLDIALWVNSCACTMQLPSKLP